MMMTGTSQTEDDARIEELRQELMALSTSVDGVDATEWKIVAVGAKACGGPSGYMAYHSSLEAEFLQKVEAYTNEQDAYNQKWGSFKSL